MPPASRPPSSALSRLAYEVSGLRLTALPGEFGCQTHAGLGMRWALYPNYDYRPPCFRVLFMASISGTSAVPEWGLVDSCQVKGGGRFFEN
jgi:hypothetical protein